MAIPLFILGKQRSGTTWLANQLCQHPQVAGITHEAHDGIHESSFFSDVAGRYGDLDVRSNFLEFVQVLSASDYYRLSGLPKSFLLSLWGSSYTEIFRSIMDRFAECREARYWLEKSPEHTMLVDQLADYYPDARFVAVIREPESTVASMLSFKPLGLSRTHRKQQIVRTTLGWLLFSRKIEEFASRSTRLHLVRYEKMLIDLRAVMSGVCNFLGLPFADEVVAQTFRPNSSFGGDPTARKRSLSRSERALIRATVSLGNALPTRALEKLRPVDSGSLRKELPSWFFSMTELDGESAIGSDFRRMA